MIVLGQIAVFGAGLFLMIALIGAFYGVVDLWYMIGKAWPRVIRAILAWAIAIAVLAWLLPPPYRTAFAWGLAAYLIFYVSLFPLFRILLRIRRRS